MNEAAVVLQELLTNGCFESRVANVITLPNVMRKTGVDDQEFEKASKELHLQDFSKSLKSTALGLLELAKVDKKNRLVLLIKNQSQTIYPLPQKNFGAATIDKMILGFNFSVDSDEGSLFHQTSIWEIEQYLKFQAVILYCCTTDKTSFMDIIFSYKEHNLTGLRIGQTGETSLLNIFLKLEYSPKARLNYFLGKIPIGNLVHEHSFCTDTGGGNIEEYLCFPDAKEFIAKNMHSLGNHFTCLASTFPSGTT